MNLEPSDRDKLQAYLDALEAVPIPQPRDERLQAVALKIVIRLEKLIDDAEEWIK